MPPQDGFPSSQAELDQAYLNHFRSTPRFPESPAVTVVEGALVSPSTFHLFREASQNRDRLEALLGEFGRGFRFRSVFDAGVHTAAGNCVLPAIHHSSRRRAVPPRRIAPPDGAEMLPGTWLYAGALHQHPGHFVTESIGRLWGLALAGQGVEGLIWHAMEPPPAGATQARAAPFRPGSVHADVLDCMGIRLPRLIVQRPLRVERLLVPDQLQALDDGPLLSGHPVFRHFLQERLIPPGISHKGGYRLFVSRAGLGARQSSFVLEARMEEVLRRQGWRILRPETIPLREQFEVYAGASELLFSEGSSLHFFALVARPGQRVVILRRRLAEKRHLAAQLRHMGLAEVQEWLCVRTMVTPEPDPTSTPRPDAGLAERPLLDFEDLRGRLVGFGMLDGSAPPFASPEEVSAEIDQIRGAWQQEGYRMAQHPVAVAGGAP